MSVSLAAVAATQNQVQNAMQMSMLKSAHQQDQALVDILSQAVEQTRTQAAAPAGTGTLIDITA